MSGLVGVLLLASVVAPSDGSDVVRVRARPEIPWIVVVAAVAPSGPGCAASQPEVRALMDAGGTFQARPVVEAGGPPEAEGLVMAAARACGRGPMFLEGRTSSTDAGALPRPPPMTTGSPAAPGGGGSWHRLAAGPGLLDVEGEALALFVAEALAPLGPVTARIAFDGVPALVVDAPQVAPHEARALLDGAVAQPLAPARVEAIRAKARGRVAARRAEVGGWARDAARMWLLTGQIEVEEPADLGVRLRARVFPALLFPG